MNFDKIIDCHPHNYPGKHLESQPRASPSFKPMEPKAQFHIIIKALKTYIKEKLQGGKGVVVRNLGAFTFEIKSGKKLPAQLFQFDSSRGFNEHTMKRKHVHNIRPCFLVDGKFKSSLSRFANKDEIDAPKSQNNVFQKGFNMLYCNAGPISSACYLSRESTQSSIQALVQAISDLTTLGYDLNLDFGFTKLIVRNKDLKVKYNPSFVQSLNKANFEQKLQKSKTKTSSFWKPKPTVGMKSTMNSLFIKPDQKKTESMYQKTLALKIMSLDLNTTEKTYFNKEGN